MKIGDFRRNFGQDDDAGETEGLEELLQRWGPSEQRSRRRSTRQRKPVSRNLGKDSRYPEFFLGAEKDHQRVV